MLQLNLIGLVDVLLDGQPVTFGRRGSVALLAYLALSAGPHSRDALATLLAGDSTEDQARKYLSNVLADLHQHLGDYVRATRHTVMFAHDRPHRLDVSEFRNSLTRALDGGSPEDLARALELYRDEFLNGLVLFGAPDFEEWMAAVREDVRCHYLLGLGVMVESSMSRDSLAAGITAARRLVREEPWLEEAHCQLMVMLARSGQRQAAIKQYEACRRVLREELGIEPQPTTTALFKRVLAASTQRRHNLPSPVTSFVGRQAELRLLRTLLCNADCRQVTVAGLGGSGKSRLAMEVGREFALPDGHLAEQPFPDGVVFVALAELAPAAGGSECGRQAAADAIFAALEVALELPRSLGSSARDRVLDYLRSKEVLLIFDNLEHLLAGRAAVSDVLTQAPHVKVVVTSRAPLHIVGERVLPLDGLTMPADEDELDNAAASALFVAEARRLELGYQVRAEDRSALVELCRVLGGLPLGLILAARWAPVLTCAQMLVELDNGLDILATSEPDLPERQRSLPRVLESALSGLQSKDRALTRDLALEREGDGPPDGRVGLDHLARVRSLREQALVSFDAGRGRLQLHPLLRWYLVRQSCSRSTPACATRSAELTLIA